MVAEMTKDELMAMIEVMIERKLQEMVADPDADLDLRPEVRTRLIRQKQAVAEGERGEALDDVVRRLGLD
jgi:hypothetical protein